MIINKFLSALMLVSLISFSVTSPAVAGSIKDADIDNLMSDAPADAPDYDPNVALPGPDDLTWDHVPDVNHGDTEPGSDAREQLQNRSRSYKSVGCSLNTSHIYGRKSAKDMKYGGVGAKPWTSCSKKVKSIEQHSIMYKEVWWGLQKVGGIWSSHNKGEKSLTQKTITVKCADRRDTKFRLDVKGTVVTYSGDVAQSAAWEKAELPCGTNP